MRSAWFKRARPRSQMFSSESIHLFSESARSIQHDDTITLLFRNIEFQTPFQSQTQTERAISRKRGKNCLEE